MTVVEISGIDEGGRIGKLIFFVRLGIPLPSEMRLVLHNLDHFDTPIMTEQDFKGRDAINMMKYATSIIDDSSFTTNIFVLREPAQLALLHLLSRVDTGKLFSMRKALVDILKDEGDTVDVESLEPLARFLDSYQTPSVYLESFVKAYGMRYIATKLANIARVFTLTDPDRFMILQVDGGFPFVFWWPSLIASATNPFKDKGRVFFAGITGGDEYYPVLSAAGGIANALVKYPPHPRFIPIHDIPPPEELEFPTEEFVESHRQSLTRPSFQHRIIFVGRIGDKIRSLLPYSLHRQDKSKTFEPFYIAKSAEGFFKNWGFGRPEDTQIIYGSLDQGIDKANLKYCKEEGLKCSHVSEEWGSVEGFLKEIEEEISVLPASRRVEMEAKLQKVRVTAQNESK